MDARLGAGGGGAAASPTSALSTLVSVGRESDQELATCLLASPAGLGARPAMLVHLSMPLALVTADFAGHCAGLDQRPDGVGVKLGLAGYDGRRGRADIGAIQTQPDALHEVGKVSLAQIGVNVSSARPYAVVERVNGAG